MADPEQMTDDEQKLLRDQIRENIFTFSTWVRIFFMGIYGIIAYFTIFIILIVVVFQFGHKLLTGKLNEHLLPLGQSLSTYVYQILTYVTYVTEERPFPLGSWPHEPDCAPDLYSDLPKEPEPPQKSD